MRVFAVVFSLLVVGRFGGLALGDGDPTSALSDTGIIVPVDEPRAYVLDQHITVTLQPKPHHGGELKGIDSPEAIVRVEYVLLTPVSSRSSAPLKIMVGWPTSGLYTHVGPHGTASLLPLYHPSIKLDGKPLPWRMLTMDDLADQYVQPWMRRIDSLLESKPALKREVLAARKQMAEEGQPSDPIAATPIGTLAHTLQEQGLADGGRAVAIAGGLLGVPAGSHQRRDETVQDALRWLDPSAPAPIDLQHLLYERWGHDSRLLDPATSRLVDARSGWEPEDEPPFGVFQFTLMLEPGKKHRLVVQYGQDLGGFTDSDWSGLVYSMEAAKRWGRWEQTTIEVRVPHGPYTVAIRPRAERAGDKDGFFIHRIELGRPHENLYISLRELHPTKPRAAHAKPPQGEVGHTSRGTR